MIKFKIPGNPPRTTSQEKGVTIQNGRPVFYTPAKLRQAENSYLNSVWPYRPEEPITGAVALFVTFTFATKEKKKWHKPKTTRPDTDNMIKALKDVLTAAGFWKDDALIAREVVSKDWGETGSTEITIVDIDKARRDAEMLAAQINAGANK